MTFYNINNPSEKVSLMEAVLRSSPNDKGLYMPCSIPKLKDSFFKELAGLSLQQIAVEVSNAMFGEEIPAKEIEKIVYQALDFDTPLKKLERNLYVLELFHGPTLAFKDIGARFMAGMFEYFLKGKSKQNLSSTSEKVIILAATSGDTGSAVANAFYNKENIEVVVLYPSGKVSDFQEKQIAGLGGNIVALEVKGDFDDCQRMVKEAFSDPDLNRNITLTSANSINFSRLFPQSFYYFHAIGQLIKMEGSGYGNYRKVISVPSGNFGNLTAGLIAKRMGLAVDIFIAANNSNHAVADFLESGRYTPQQTVHTMSNAMDVGNPSNFPRVLDLYQNLYGKIISDIEGDWFDDRQTCGGMLELSEVYGYQADPHGAVAYLALKKHLQEDNCAGIFLETAHPAKFPEAIMRATNKSAPVPYGMERIKDSEKKSIPWGATRQDTIEFIKYLRRLAANPGNKS